MKKKFPFWFVAVFGLIPFGLSTSLFVLLVIDQGYGFSGYDWSVVFDMIIDLWESLPFEMRYCEFVVIGVAWAFLFSALQIVWFYGGFGIFKLKQILHSKKAPR